MQNDSLRYLFEHMEVRLLHRNRGERYDTFSTEVEIDLEIFGVYQGNLETTQFDIDIVHNKEKHATYFVNVTPKSTDDEEIFQWFNEMMGPRLMDVFYRAIYEFVKEKRSIAEIFSDDSFHDY